MADIIDHGQGPVLVFLHGAGVDNRLWDPQLLVFEKTHRVIALNLPGHGTVPAVGSVEDMADWVHRQLTDLGINRYCVIGLSLGGMVALELASRHPDHVSHLVMIESVPNAIDSRIARPFAHVMLMLLRLIPVKLLAKLPGRSMGAETDDAAKYVQGAIGRMSTSNIYAVMRAALAYDGRPHLPHISMPATIMVGEKNKATHARAEDASRTIKAANFRVIPGAGHIANRDAVEFTNNALRAALGDS
ncbi:Alpha/beta hydrolase family protein [Aliiroseovarius halocynthiae]|uniref:Alpha/beta fold hydrolase n=1 Tax=Aliiroseovarius halocynthiae TaxID=985055 RepID=A0A545SZC9_9RHOB|nr:alpha/beta fold hydrolase [Aliiroseovarius halocynthiae]TQV70335.1 alpha/beta fold hydrolase [Aliiroseovarius halocynthiae]SMR81992.1 Alpha/beta hydrolase family protein [Aliiroseovarius halocynthiae]